MFRACANNPIGFIEGDNLSLHSFIFFLSIAVTALSTAATLLADEPGFVATLHTLFAVVIVDKVHNVLLFMSLLEASKASFFLRMHDVDDLHSQPRESVDTSERPPESMHVGHIHPWTSATESHCKRM